MFRRSFLSAILIVAMVGSTRFVYGQTQVHLKVQDGQFELLRNGKPYAIKGVGGDSHFAKLAAAGGNSVRTWDSHKLGDVLDEADRHGLTVCAGLWLGHQRHGFSYQNQEAVLKQLDGALDAVRKHKDHPALLLWGVGNEMEGEGGDPSVWYAVNHLAREIKRIDPHHPTMTVIAELGDNESKIKSIERFCPDVDIIGVNSYGGIESIGERFGKVASSKPYIVTEHGPLGPWEAGKTQTGSPVEFTSTEKGEWYRKGYRANAIDRAGLCLGTYAFIWGHKQETTATWFGMLLPDGTRLAAVDAMTELWTGAPPKNGCPKILSLELDHDRKFEAGDRFNAMVSVSDPEQDPLKIEWILRSDSATIGAGGDPQESESTIANAVVSKGAEATVTLPKGGGGYRLFAYVYDQKGGAAVANAPIHIHAPIQLKSVMPVSELPYSVYTEGSASSVYVPSGYMGNAEAVGMQLDHSDNPHAGKTCIKAEYKSGSSWGGVLWQSPAQDWDGMKPGGANLTGATRLEFWVRGERGGEIVNFVFGVLNGNQPYRDTASGELKNVKLTKEWKKLSFPLEGFDLRQIKTGFGWSLAGQDKPVTFYLDDIRYVE